LVIRQSITNYQLPITNYPIYRLPLRNARTKITIGPEITISPKQVNCKTTSQLMLAKTSIFSSQWFYGLKRFNNSMSKPATYHICLGDLKFNLLHKIIRKVIKK